MTNKNNFLLYYLIYIILNLSVFLVLIRYHGLHIIQNIFVFIFSDIWYVVNGIVKEQPKDLLMALLLTKYHIPMSLIILKPNGWNQKKSLGQN